MKRSVPLALLLSTLAASFVFGQSSVWSVAEMQPDIQQGGRADSIAVHPANSDIMIVATESGGLFRTADRGTTWRHIDTFPTFWTRGAVMFLPADPSIVIATAIADFKSTNGGGIWRSTDGGVTWAQATSPPPPVGTTTLFEAREISVAPDTGTIYVATSYGVAISIDRGVTWTHKDPFGAASDRVQSVLALSNNVILAGGPAGMRRSINGGTNWGTPASTGGSVFHDANTHAFSSSPYWPDHAYMVNGSSQLFFTENGGDDWTRIASAPNAGSPGCGGIAFVKARIPAGAPGLWRSLDLWFGNRCELHKLNAPEVVPAARRMTPRTTSSPSTFDYGGSWTKATLDHGDTRDLAFDGAGQPLLLATDGGLHKTTNGGLTWTFTGGGRNGFNALQITEVKGQGVWDRNRHDLYFGTQDNNLWASGDAGQTWINPVCCEGFHIDAQPRIALEADSKVTFVRCGSCIDLVSDPLFANVQLWPDAQTPPNGNPAILGRSLHVQGVNTGGAFSAGFARSTDLGTTWQQHSTFPEQRLSMPRLVLDGRRIPVLYQAIRTGMTPNGTQIDKLVRVTGKGITIPATVRYPRMTNFGSLGVNPTMFAWYEVFGVDPENSHHLIAPDIINEKMMETFDAGNNWTEMPALTSLVTDGGRYVFGQKKGGGWVHGNATAVSFNRDDPNFVAVGTMEGGILTSMDRGATWSRVAGSERITFITSIEWKSINEAIVSSYGRGLWRLNLLFVLPLPEWEPYCSGLCVHLPFVPPVIGDPITTTVLVFNGEIQGGSATTGSLQNLYVTPGSSVVIFTDTGDAGSIRITESATAVGWTGASAPKTPDGQSMVGVTLGKSAKPIGAAFTKDPLVMYTPTETETNQDDVPIGDEKSPTAGKPYLVLDISTASNMVMPAAPVRISGRDFPPAVTIEIAVDNETAASVETSDRGELSLTLNAPSIQGLHTVKALDGKGNLLDGATFLVGHEDREE